MITKREPKQIDPKHNDTSSLRELGLEEIIHLSNKLGIEYAEKRKEAERLELLRTSFRSKIMNKLESQEKKIPESKLKRLAEASEEYITFLEKIVLARSEAEKLRIRYESYKNLFEARRTLISYKKMELKTL